MEFKPEVLWQDVQGTKNSVGCQQSYAIIVVNVHFVVLFIVAMVAGAKGRGREATGCAKRCCVTCYRC
jgi:hypothetical protein